MKLAVNYLSEVKELYEENKIDFVDYFKLYSINDDLSPFDWCSEHKDVLFHGFAATGSNVANIDFWENRDIELQREYYKRGNTPYISMHINKTDETLESEENTLKRIKDNVDKIKENFNMELILENVPARYDDKSRNFISSPEFITKVINENDCGFLFDIGHARVAADALEIPFDEYVARLPMDRLIEIHLAGCIKREDGRFRAPHKKMNEEDYMFLEEAIKKYKTLQIVTLEYGPFKENNQNCDYPIVSYNSVNKKAKEEVYEQLVRIEKIIKENS